MNLSTTSNQKPTFQPRKPMNKMRPTSQYGQNSAFYENHLEVAAFLSRRKNFDCYMFCSTGHGYFIFAKHIFFLWKNKVEEPVNKQTNKQKLNQQTRRYM